ncbi:unnamed protein product [Closterium sp. Yama58-4]|nr:unnamed protein product [Closterium sp. Yama58-4]
MECRGSEPVLSMPPPVSCDRHICDAASVAAAAAEGPDGLLASRAIRKKLEDVEIRALEGKLQLLETQRQLSASPSQRRWSFELSKKPLPRTPRRRSEDCGGEGAAARSYRGCGETARDERHDDGDGDDEEEAEDEEEEEEDEEEEEREEKEGENVVSGEESGPWRIGSSRRRPIV